MGSLDIREHTSLETLLGVYIREKSPELSSRAAGRGLVFAEPLMAAPALVAYWIREFAPELLDKKTLRIAIVSAVPGRPELAMGSRTYQMLPELLGKPRMKIAISSVIAMSESTEDDTTDGAFTQYELPLHAYLENAPDGPVDLIVLHDMDIQASKAVDWVEPLGRAIVSGTKVAAVAIEENEQLLIQGLLELHGFTIVGEPRRNQFAPRLPWGGQIWQVGASEVNPTIPDGVIAEVHQLFVFVRWFAEHHEGFPPLHEYGVRVTGKESPSQEGSPMIRLPEGLFFDPATERFSGLTRDGLVSVHELDEMGRNSALLASYEGRGDRFHQLLWAIRVFFDCVELDPNLMPRDEESADDDPQVCPNCGKEHTATERVDTMKQYLSEVFEGESPRTQVRAALELALDIVKRGGGVPESEGFEGDEGYSKLKTFESLLNLGYLTAAWAMVQESGEFELVEEGVDQDGWSLPMLIVQDANWALLAEYMVEGGFVGAFSDDGGTLYHAIACSEEPIPAELFLQAREALVEQDIYIDSPDDMGITPLEAGVITRNWASVALLVEAGADVSQTELDPAELADALAENGFDNQADKVRQKPKTKRTRKASASNSKNQHTRKAKGQNGTWSFVNEGDA